MDSGGASGGSADFSLGSTSYQFPTGSFPAVVVSASGTHTISTNSDNPSYVRLPGLYGV